MKKSKKNRITLQKLMQHKHIHNFQQQKMTSQSDYSKLLKLQNQNFKMERHK